MTWVLLAIIPLLVLVWFARGWFTAKKAPPPGSLPAQLPDELP
jgi:hypothetical protein